MFSDFRYSKTFSAVSHMKLTVLPVFPRLLTFFPFYAIGVVTKKKSVINATVTKAFGE